MAAAAIPLAVGAASGLIQNNQKQAEYNRQKQLAADTERYSPWTGQHGQMPSGKPNLFNSVLQGGMTGLSFAQGLGGMGGAPGAAANPMAGAEQVKPMNPVSAPNTMAGGFSQSPWSMQKAPNFYT